MFCKWQNEFSILKYLREKRLQALSHICLPITNYSKIAEMAIGCYQKRSFNFKSTPCLEKLYSCLKLCQMPTTFQNSFTGKLSSKFLSER